MRSALEHFTDDRLTLGMAIRFMISDRVISRERRDLCLRLKRFIQSRRRSRALMRAFRRTGPNTHASKHFRKPCRQFDNADDKKWLP